MHDTFLFQKISDALVRFCEQEKINKITKVCVTVNPDSHVTQDSLKLELQNSIDDLLHKDIEIVIENKKLEEMSAIISRIEGEK